MLCKREQKHLETIEEAIEELDGLMKKKPLDLHKTRLTQQETQGSGSNGRADVLPTHLRNGRKTRSGAWDSLGWRTRQLHYVRHKKRLSELKGHEVPLCQTKQFRNIVEETETNLTKKLMRISKQQNTSQKNAK